MPTPSTDTGASQDGNTSSGATSTAGDEFKPITSQDDLNRIITDRVNRERSKFSDYKDVKAKAERLDEIEEANKSELDKANGRATEAETQRDDARAEALRLRVAVQHGIGLEDADLFLTGRDEETLLAQAKRLSDREADRKKKSNVVPKEGATTAAGEADDRETVRAIFGGD